MTPDPREIHAEIEVPGTPEQVWAAIATGPGITSWFMPARVDEREGGEIVHGDGGFSSRGRVIAWQPPHRFAYEEGEEVVGLDPEHPIATEWLVEARSGGTCVVRLVMSGFAPGDDFDKARESFSSGWRTALRDLRLYLTHFAGQDASPITAASTVQGRTRDDVWAQLTSALGVPADAAPGDRIEARSGATTTLAGTVQEAEPGIVTLLLDAPTVGLGLIGAGGPGDDVFTFVRAHLFGDEASAIAARDEPAWQAWLGEQFATG
jgi:uncharacterized protein YndB with AHSA1/START domain